MTDKAPKPEPKSAVKKAQSATAEKQAASKEAAPEKNLTRKEQLAADFPVERSGLGGISQDVLNPAFAPDAKTPEADEDDSDDK